MPRISPRWPPRSNRSTRGPDLPSTRRWRSRSSRGLFELKSFFTSAIAASRGGDAHSAEAVRFRIRSLIDGEQSDSTLSDERIVELLQQDGVDIARRTVAKYREAMRIPSSVQRRREKTLSL